MLSATRGPARHPPARKDRYQASLYDRAASTVAKRRLTPTSYIILGLLELAPGTPYDLKSRAASVLRDFWSVKHAQFYTETERLATDGLLSEERESEGRRRKTYAITEEGRQALVDWLATPSRKAPEVRDTGVLKLFLGADPALIAAAELPAHRAKLAEYEELERNAEEVLAVSSIASVAPNAVKGALLALKAGIGHEREYIRFWSGLAEE